jgi:hypothetical protein
MKIAGESDVPESGQSFGLRFGVLAKPKRFWKNQNPWSTCRVTFEIEMTLHQKAVRLVAENFRVHQTVQLNDTAMSIAREFGVPDHIFCRVFSLAFPTLVARSVEEKDKF